MDPVPVERLEREWRRRLADPTLAEQLDRWRELEPALRPFRRASAVLGYLQAGTPAERKDAVLRALLRQARTDTLAAELVLQTLLPGLKATAGRILLDVNERPGLWSLLLASMWERIRTYPVERLPRRVAANLLLDAQKSALKQLRNARREVALAPERFDRPLAAQPENATNLDELVCAAVADGALSAQDAEVIVRSRLESESLVAITHEMGVDYDALRIRRRRAERRLARWLEARGVRFGGSERPVLGARVAGAGSSGLAGGEDQPKPPRR